MKNDVMNETENSQAVMEEAAKTMSQAAREKRLNIQ